MIFSKFIGLINKHPMSACLLAGIGTAAAFATPPVFPALILSGVLLIAIHDETKAWKAGLLSFLYALGMFTVSLYWVQNALGVTFAGGAYVLRFGALIGLPLLLTPLWILAAWLSVRLTAPGSLARSTLFVTLLALAEYGRAFLFTGFPWNLFAGAWAGILPIMQIASLGGVFLLNALTIFWALTPAMLLLTRHNRKILRGLSILALSTLILAFAYGAMRVTQNVTVLRDDTAVVVLQPNIPQNEKWDPRHGEENFYKHINLSKEGLQAAASSLPETVKTISILWPETALDEYVVFTQEKAVKELVELLKNDRFKVFLVTGLMRSVKDATQGQKEYFYNSIAVLSQNNNALNMEDLYDKAHLVPFGEYIPLADKFGLKPVTGFSGFTPGGYGPRVLHAPGFPSAAALVCYETIFPWAIEAADDKGDAEWIINVSNDSWYGDTMGPYQHLAISRFRAIEQGLPLLRSTPTGISAIIDSYGRVLDKIPYGESGHMLLSLPQKAGAPPLYRSLHETIFFILMAACLWLSSYFHKKKL